MYLIVIVLILALAGGYSAYYNNYGTVLKKAKKRLAQGQPQIALKLFKSGNKQYPIIAEKFLQQDGPALLENENKQAAIDFLLPLAEDYPFVENWLAEHAAQLLAQKEFIPFRHLVLSAPEADWSKKLLFKYLELPEAQSKLKISDKKQLLQPLLDQKEANAIRLWILLLAPFFEQDKKAEQYLPEIRTYKAQSAKAQRLFYLFLSNRQKKRELAPYLSELQQLAKESTTAQEIILAEAKALFERKNEATALTLIQPFWEKSADAQRLYNRIYLKKMRAEKKPQALAQVLQALERFPSQLSSQEKRELQTALANLQLQQLEYSFKPLRKKANLNDWASFVQQLLAAAKLSYKTTALEAFLEEKVDYLLQFSLEEGQSAEKAKKYKQAAAIYKKAADYARLLKDKFSQARSHIGQFDFRYVLTAIYGDIPSSRIQYYEYYLHRHSDKKEVAAIRYALAFQLAQKKQFSAALEQISWLETYSRNPQIIELKRYCLQQKQKTMLSLLAVYNATIYGSDLRKLKALDENWDTYSEALSFFYPERRKEFPMIKKYIHERIVGLYQQQEKFVDLFQLLTAQQNFFKVSPDQLKMMAVTAFKILTAEKGPSLSDTFIQKLLAVFLSAIYNNEVIFYSLEDTEWDDDYQFSQKQIIGSRPKRASFSYPENINNQAVSSDNIDLGAVQKRLLKTLEDHLQSSYSATLLQFYEAEKIAIQLACQYFPLASLNIPSPFLGKYDKSSANELYLKLADQLPIPIQDKTEIDAIRRYAHAPSPKAKPIIAYDKLQKIEAEIELRLKGDRQRQLSQSCSLSEQNLIQKYFPLDYQELLQRALRYLENGRGGDRGDRNYTTANIRLLQQNIFRGEKELDYLLATHLANLAIGEVNEDQITQYEAFQKMRVAQSYHEDSAYILRNTIAISKHLLLEHVFSGLETKQANEVKQFAKSLSYNYQKEFKEAAQEALQFSLEQFGEPGSENRVLFEREIGYTGRRGILDDYSFLYEARASSSSLNRKGLAIAGRMKWVKQLSEGHF